MGALTFSRKEERESLKAFLAHLRPGAHLRLGETALELTPELADLLRSLLEPLAQGEPVRVVPLEAELTTQEAADILGVSRPYLVRLLEEGKIPFRRVGSHRRVRAQDLLAYLEASRKEGRKLLDQLIAEGQELGIGY
ncbi:helix-turn-helix domain-containing protein [Thermus thermamylovorans]|uniref:DNA-binding protein n=1 Tax=Thermus thermamylovorans TaxID=2509362 RepID=A0A4Q9B7G0_9DEIN|nr:helix-turn-helix domain-containing protein [Thermus thermamylovorans]TBH21761.1 DNA-binding protein [Thermus thermamylovorans]